jgi:hypothetical protein
MPHYRRLPAECAQAGKHALASWDACCGSGSRVRTSGEKIAVAPRLMPGGMDTSGQGRGRGRFWNVRGNVKL